MVDVFAEARRVESRKQECKLDGIYHARYFFKQRFDTKMIIDRHHRAMQAALDRTMLDQDDPQYIPRLIINLPPGYTKTELASINYMARGLAVNPMARFLHLSYSNKLVLENSAKTRAIVKSPRFQQMFERNIKEDIDSKEIWTTEDGGGVTASTTMGQVTGFRAGHMVKPSFSGALVIDDPIKPDDAYSEKAREGINNNYGETISSRVAVEETPIILIMQRVHWNDLAGFLLCGGSGEPWHHLNLPVFIDNSVPYPEEYTHGIQIQHGLPNGWLWRFKHNEKHRIALESNRRKYRAQYMQAPIKRDQETALWREKVISDAKEADFKDYPIIRTVVAVDPATTNTESSDEHGIIVASEHDFRDQDNKYTVQADYSRKGGPLDWALAVIAAYEQNDADAVLIETNQGGDMCESNLRNAGYTGLVIRITAKKGKALRAEPVVALYELRRVAHKAGLSDLEDEQLDFDPVTQKSNGKSPNRVDATVYALAELSGISSNLENLLKIAIGG
jgi:phage terminase large subunit-like protein